jgi:hypothetical protein
VVVAADRYLARDAADAIRVERPAARGGGPRARDDGSAGGHSPRFANNLAVPLVPGGTGVSLTASRGRYGHRGLIEAEVVISSA